MAFPRRQFLHLVGIAAALPALSRLAWAQGFPTRPVHWIVSFTAGGPNDTVARIIGQYLSERLGQQFVIENKVDAGGNIGMAAVLSSPPDGYTIGFVVPIMPSMRRSTTSCRSISFATAYRLPGRCCSPT
jgi:tripartite-type tricarboxylate transporter receptor subunit TctC